MQVLQKAAKQGIAKMVLVVPWWVTKPFFASLQVNHLQSGLWLNPIASGNATGRQEAEGRQGPSEGLDLRPLDPGHQEMQAGRLSCFWEEGPGAEFILL